MSDLTRLEASGNFKEALDVLKQNPSYDATYFFNLSTQASTYSRSALRETMLMSHLVPSSMLIAYVKE